MKAFALVCFVLLMIFSVLSVRDELMEAVFVADVNKVESLIRSDSTILSSKPPVLVNRKDSSYGRTSIMVCGLDPQSDKSFVDSQCVLIAELLKVAGANLSHVDNTGWDALSMAAVRGYSQLASYLMDHNVSARNVDLTGMTALMKAAAHGHLETFRVIYEHEGISNLRMKDNLGLTALHYAVNMAMSNSTYIPFLKNVLHIVTNTTSNDSAVTSTPPSSTLLAKYSVIDKILDNDGRTILMYAVLSRHVQITDMLLNTFYCNPTLSDKHDQTVTSMSSRLVMSNGSSSTTSEEAGKEILRMIVQGVIAHIEREHSIWLTKNGMELDSEGSEFETDNDNEVYGNLFDL